MDVPQFSVSQQTSFQGPPDGWINLLPGNILSQVGCCISEFLFRIGGLIGSWLRVGRHFSGLFPLPAHRNGQYGCCALIPCCGDADGPECPHHSVKQLCAHVGIIDMEPVSAVLYCQYRSLGFAL